MMQRQAAPSGFTNRTSKANERKSSKQTADTQDRLWGIAVAHRIDIRMKASGVTGSGGTDISRALFLLRPDE